MNRRQFVTALFGTVGALLVVPRLEALLRPEQLALGIDNTLDSGFLVVYDVTLSEFRRLFDQSYRDYLGQGYARAPRVADTRIGTVLESGAVVGHQWNVGYSARELEGPMNGRHLPAAAGALAIAAAQAGCGELAHPPIPHALIYARANGPIRFCSAVSIDSQDWGTVLYRFDVLGAETPGARAAAERVRQRGLKVRIKERLRIGYGSALRLPA